MKKVIRRVLLFLLLLFLFPGILVSAELRLPSLYSESYYAELPALYDHLTEAAGKKLVIIGGSSVAFGVDTELLTGLLAEQGFSYTVCSFGLYAAVGTSAMLDLALDTLSEGDLVVLSFEPDSKAMSTYFGATAFLKCAEDRTDLILKLDRSRIASVFGNAISFLQERVAIVRSGEYPKVEGVYARSSFDENGNMTYVREGNAMTLGYDTASPIDLASLTIADDFIEEVSEFCAAAEKKGATVTYSFCPMNRSAVTDTGSDVLLAYFRTVAAAFPCTVISDPNNYLMDSGWFYDSNFHLNSAGAEVRTVSLAKDLLAHLGCFAPVDYPLPEMPASIAAAQVPEEETGDAACFCFEPIADGAAVRITGLTAEGAERDTLSVPASYEGKPVVALASDALGDNDVLKELTLPGTIETIPSGLFSGCTVLERLILTHTDGPCGLSENGLQSPSSFRILVPRDSYSYYRDGTGCETNPWSAFLSRIFAY